MTTLKDVAALAGVSIAAVSLYVNGKSEGRVSLETQRKIEQAIEETGYVSTAARKSKLPPQERTLENIALFWSIDFHQDLLGAFMSGIQNAIIESGAASQYDYTLRPYRSNQLYLHKRILCGRQYRGIIIANASAADVQYLQGITPQVPVILINRRLPSYHSVYIDSAKAGEQAAELIFEKGYTSISTVRSQSQYIATNSRFSEFIQASRKKGIQMPNDFQIIAEDSIEGGIAAAREFLSYPDRPSLIFASTDLQAFGLLKGLKRAGVQVPGECAIFSYGFERSQLTLYSNPPLSVMDISTAGLAHHGTQLLFEILNKGITAPQMEELSCSIVLRDSF